MLGQDLPSSPGAGFERLACLPPSIIRLYINATKTTQFEGQSRTGLPDWDELMGNANPHIQELKEEVCSEMKSNVPYSDLAKYFSTPISGGQ